MLVEPDFSRHRIGGPLGTWGKGWLHTWRKGAKGFFVSLLAEATTRVVERKYKRPVNGGVHNQKGSEVQRSVNSDQTRSRVSRSRGHCVLLRMLTRRIGHSQLLWDTAPKDCMGIAQGAIALLARGSLGDGLASLSPESRRRPACSSPKDDAGSRASLTGQQPLRCRQCSSAQLKQCLITEVFLVVLSDSTALSLGCQPAMARLRVGLWLDVHSRAMHGLRGTAIPMSQDDVVVEMNRCFNPQCLVRQRVRELVEEAAPLVWRPVEGGKTATTSYKPSTECLDDNKQRRTNASTGDAGGLRSR